MAKRLSGFIISACNMSLEGSFGSILSPQYPGYYTNNASCVWRLRVPRSHVIRLEFLYFDLEYHPQCSNDFVEVRDGFESSTVLGRFCGQSFPSAIESSGRTMLITFVSNERLIGGGFRARYRAIKGKLVKWL